MPIRLRCECGQEIPVPEQHAGRCVRCPNCQRENVLADRADLVTTTEPPPPQPGGPVKTSRDYRFDEPPSSLLGHDEEDDGRQRPRRSLIRPDGPERTSLVLGLLSICLGPLAGVPAVIFGVIALIDISRSKGRLSGRGKAIAGMTTGILFSILTILGVHWIQQDRREARERYADRNHLKLMAIAVHNYHDTYQSLPETGMPDRVGNLNGPKSKTRLSLRVHLLPFIEQDHLYHQFNLDEPWDSPTNKRLIPRMPTLYIHPKADPQWTQYGKTVYRVFTGPLCAFNPGASIPRAIPDGDSNSIMIAESEDPVIWTKPDEFEYDPNQPLPKLGQYYRGVYQFAMFDGSTRTVPTSVSEKTLRAIITSNGNDIPGSDW